MTTNKLAEFFNRQRELIEAAETPFAKLAIFILPILSPMVPATLTGMHLYQLFLDIFNFPGSDVFAVISAVIPSIVLELLGYVGAISFIQALFRWIEGRYDVDGDKFLVPAVLNFLAYVFYLAAMWMINVSLGEYFGTPTIVNSIVGLLSFITVPTSLLAANHLAIKDHDSKEERIRQERREDKLKKKMIDSGMNPMAPQLTQYQSTSPSPLPQPEPQRKNDWRLLGHEERRKVKYGMSIKEIVSIYGVSRATAYNWKSDESKYPL